jgi:peptide/nickel transport system ATP-binding protein
MTEALRAHEQIDSATAQTRALDMLERSRSQARKRFDAYRHELSGGMRQRAMIALALVCKPKLLLSR